MKRGRNKPLILRGRLRLYQATQVVCTDGFFVVFIKRSNKCLIFLFMVLYYLYNIAVV